jgi:hypothetical protein
MRRWVLILLYSAWKTGSLSAAYVEALLAVDEKSVLNQVLQALHSGLRSTHSGRSRHWSGKPSSSVKYYFVLTVIVVYRRSRSQRLLWRTWLSFNKHMRVTGSSFLMKRRNALVYLYVHYHSTQSSPLITGEWTRSGSSNPIFA